MWSACLPATVSRPSWVGWIDPSPSPRRISWTLGERFQIRIDSGRSEAHRMSTRPATTGSAGGPPRIAFQVVVYGAACTDSAAMVPGCGAAGVAVEVVGDRCAG